MFFCPSFLGLTVPVSKHYGVGQFDSVISVLFFKGAELRKSNQTLDTRGIDKQR